MVESGCANALDPQTMTTNVMTAFHVLLVRGGQ